MTEVETVNGEFPLPVKRSFAHGRTIGTKKTIVTEFKSNINELKRLGLDDFGKMFAYYVDYIWFYKKRM